MLGGYGGDQIQINTRVPEGLERKIDILLRPEFGFKRKSDFTRCAVINLLNRLAESDGAFYYAEELAAWQKEVSEMTTKAVSDGLSKGMSLEDIFNNLKKSLEDKGYRRTSRIVSTIQEIVVQYTTHR